MEFLRFVAEKIYNDFKGKMENVTLVLPTRRAGLFVKNYLGELAGETPVCAPQCTTISDLFDSLCEQKAVDEIKAVCMLYDIYSATMKEYYERMKTLDEKIKPLPLDCFYGWGRQLIADFNNVDKNFKDSPGEVIFGNSMEAHKFDVSNIDEDIRERILRLMRGDCADVSIDEISFRHNFEVIWQKLPEMYAELHRKLSEQRYALEGARNKWVIQNFDKIWSSISDRTYVFAGFNILLGAEKQLLRLFKEKGSAVFFWDYDKTFDEKEKNIHAYKHTRQNIEVFGGEYESSSPSDRPINIISASSDNAQARYVYTWLKETHKPGDKTAIVLCNESMLQPVIYSVPQDMSDNVNITKGFPLKHTQVFAKITAWLHDKKNVNGDFKTVLQNLKQMVEEIPQTQALSVPQDKSAKSDESLTLWYDLLARESEYQAHCVIVRFLQLLEDGTLSQVTEFHTLANLLVHHLTSVSIPFHGEPITDIQIIGVLETRTLDFDNVLLLNVEEGVVPRKGHDNSFIPYYLRKYYGLTTNDEQTEVYAYNFFRLLRRAKNITILYSEAQTAEGQKSMSRFVMQMLISPLYKDIIKRRILQDSSQRSENESENDFHEKLLKHGGFPTYKAKLQDRYEKQPDEILKLSPSAINTFLKCKMQFFLKYMLGLKEPQTDDSLLQVNELGTLIHESARAAYVKITNGKGKGPVTKQAIGAFLQVPDNINNAVTAAYKAMNDEYKKTNHKDIADKSQIPDVYIEKDHPIETTVARKHLEKILRNDQELGDFRIVGNEEKYFFKYPVKDSFDLYIGGSIDRLDVVKEGTHDVIRVIDYKTGSFYEEKMSAPAFEDIFMQGTKQTYMLQTMVYTHAYLEEMRQSAPNDVKKAAIKPLLLFTQKDLKNFDPHLKVAETPITDFRDYDEEFINNLETLVENILNEDTFEKVPVEQKNLPCKYCGFACLCGRESKQTNY